jgi:hypothetical protein
VTGPPGASGSSPGGAGDPANADAGHLIPNSDPSNSATSATATATGGAGGNGGVNHLIFFRCPQRLQRRPGDCDQLCGGRRFRYGHQQRNRQWRLWRRGRNSDNRVPHNTDLAGSGGMATATASGQSRGGGAVNVTASATGGSVAAGGLATTKATGQSTGSGAVDVTASATGGSGGAAGAANAYATGVALNGNVQATASANAGAGVIAGTAFAESEAKNATGEALATASAPGGRGSTSPNAVTAAAVGPSGPITPVQRLRRVGSSPTRSELPSANTSASARCPPPTADSVRCNTRRRRFSLHPRAKRCTSTSCPTISGSSASTSTP